MPGVAGPQKALTRVKAPSFGEHQRPPSVSVGSQGSREARAKTPSHLALRQ